MGLDMYLRGRKSFWRNWNKPEYDRTEDGCIVTEVVLSLGYWRKHPDLHGFIVREFADGKDNCEPVQLDAVDLRRIMKAVQARTLPHTDGFFFGSSDNTAEEIKEDLDILQKAITWLEAGDAMPVELGDPVDGPGFTMLAVKPRQQSNAQQQVMRTVEYQASW